MPDRDDLGAAWRVPPSRYLAGRPAEHSLGAPTSVYVTMADGCRLAVDVFLPDGDSRRRWPTVLILTPYVRRFELAPGTSGVEPSPNTYRYRDMFVPRGYALVVVDARGTGASFGTRDSFRSPRERADYKAIADWIVAQPWSDGAIGATGISYLGAACDFLASTGHKAVKAIAPLFAVWDTWADNYYPGGMLIKRLALVYDELMLALDHDRRELRKQFSYFANPALLGPLPVDDDRDGTLAREAVKGHLANFRMPDFITEFKCRDDALPYDPAFTSASFSPYSYLDEIPEEVAVYAVSGWTDGAGYANGVLSRYLSLPNRNKHVLLGPWDHGARVNSSPWRARQEPEFPVLGEVLRFFDQHLAGRDTGLDAEDPIHYFAVHAEEWRAAKAWPPVTGSRRLYITPGRGLSLAQPNAATADEIRADFTAGSGMQTRYERIAGIDATNYYDDWPERAGKLAGFTTAPFEEALEIAGHPVVSLWLTSSEPDAAIFVYLSEVEADGTVRYVTEGVLRAIHRAEAPAPRAYRTTWPWRGFARKDLAPMPIGEPQLLKFALLPVAWRFAAGSRIRLSISGADADHFVQTPHGRPPLLAVLSGGEQSSMLELPVGDLDGFGRRAALGGLAAMGAAGGARAVAWPEKNIVWVVPFPAGGSADVFARAIGGPVSETLGRPVVVDNRGGAGGTVGAAQVARSGADGYTMLVGYTGLTYASLVYRQPGFELMRDFAPISAFARAPAALVVNPERLDVSTLAQFIEVARRQPGSIDMASPGLATVQHLAIVMLQNRAGIELHHVPYRGGAPAMQDLLSGQVAGLFHSVGAVEPYVKSGKLRALAVAGRRREPLMPEVPTMDEVGVKDFRAATWFGLFAPKRTPVAILDRTHAAVQAALGDDEVKRVWAEQGAKVELESREDFTSFVDREGRRWSDIVKAAGVEME